MPMRQSFTAVLERNTTISEDFATEPYEVGWATEARWFVRILGCTGEAARLVLTAQISPDGMHWCDHSVPPLVISRQGDAVAELYSLGLTHFGQWLRLRGECVGEAATFTVIIYLSLKE